MALTPVETALASVLDGVRPTAVEWVPLAEAAGRTLAADLVARRTQPPFDAAAMDGWAVTATDGATAGARLRILGESAAGHGFSGVVGPGEAVRIFTGAPMPAGADTIVIQENAERDGDIVVVVQPAAPGRHVRRAGIDFRDGDVGLAAGTRLGARNLGLVAAMNHAEVAVRRRPAIAFFSTGDELVPPGATPGPDQIIASNGYGLAALIAEAGGRAIDLGLVPDDLDATRAAVRAAFETGVDALVTIGGASVGDHDFVHRALAAEGVAFDFWKLAMRPGKPLMFGRRGETRVLGLPGNPAAALVCGLLFVAPLVRALVGRRDVAVATDRMRLGAALPANDVRQDHLRGRIGVDADGRTVALPLDEQDSSLLSRFAAADLLIVRPPHAAAANAGDEVTVVRL